MEFLKTVFELLDAEPFRPFVIELRNGRQFQIDHREMVTFFPTRQRVTLIFVSYPYPTFEDFSLFAPPGINVVHVVSDGDGRGPLQGN